MTEIISDRIDYNSDIQKEYPKTLVITIHSVSNPDLGTIISNIRSYILNCNNSKIDPSISFSFCFDIYSQSSLYIQKYKSLIEYLESITEKIINTTVDFSFRGYLLECTKPILQSDFNVFIASGTSIDINLRDIEELLTKENVSYNKIS